MCGIAGLIGPAGTDTPARLEAMLERLVHRGPDHRGTLVDGPFALGHQRLSIIDVSAAAHQPMLSADGRHALVYNGELYNYRALRDELRDAGIAFRTDSDTEVVLAAWLHWGADCLARFNGMFAFAVADLATGDWAAARDRFGIKPLHYAVVDGVLLFASEVKAITAALPAPPVFRREKLAELLLYREAIRQDLLADIHTLEPGHLLHLTGGDPATLATQHWFHVSDLPEPGRAAALARQSVDARLDALERVLQESVERHLVSDVPVGSLCSGGVDSSLMTAFACRLRPDVSVYHVDIADHSERRWAEQVARHLDIDIHYDRLTRENYLAGYIEAIWYNDAPLTHPQNVPIARISALAREHGCKVLLAGEGADEGFGGYDWRYRLRWNWLRLARRTGLLARLYRKGVFALTGLWLERPRHDFIFRAWANPTDVLEQVADGGFRAALERDCRAAYGFIQDAADREVQAAMTADYRDYIGAIVHQQDRASMQAGIESRVPFLDIEVARLAANLPRADKLSRRESKRLIKTLALRHLPRAVVERTKIGFASPAADYVRSLGDACFADGFLAREGILTPAETQALLTRDPANFTHMLYGLEFWGRMFCWGQSPAELNARFIG
ncbi:asparagine synthase (glutamine-hydrolyzing) [uncultured Thiohalocapsa sp.]|uniref:asparagine synthase (glutamine-hydrolyzing) n=1 Tax=uncultured Thiohalocapsa sp. TaxID=768990 RepID=UPI0025EB3684|nr:asparagine synthase (glutamine-hydrolyzing) [uncultured Thiohalocapsa sp.]